MPRLSWWRAFQCRLCSTVIPLLLLFAYLTLEVVECKRRGDKAKGKTRRRYSPKGSSRTRKNHSEEFFYVIGAVIFLVVAPVIFFFLRSLYLDPAVPQLARLGWDALKTKFSSYLGRAEEESGEGDGQSDNMRYRDPPGNGHRDSSHRGGYHSIPIDQEATIPKAATGGGGGGGGGGRADPMQERAPFSADARRRRRVVP